MRIAWLALLMAMPAGAWTLSAGDASGWSPSRMVVHVNPDHCNVPADTLHAAVDRAMSVWNRVPTADVQLVRSPEKLTLDAEKFLRNPPAGAPAVLCDPGFSKAHKVSEHYVPAATRLWTIDERLARGAVFLNAQPMAGGQVRFMTPDELTVTLAHELGHLLGLGHSSAAEALMYYSIAGKTSPELHDDDRDGLTYLYPRNELAGGAFGCAAIHRRRGETYGPGAVAFLLTLVTTILVAGRLVVRFS